MKRLLTLCLVTFLTVYSMTWLLAGGKEALIPFLGAVPNVPVVQGVSGGTPIAIDASMPGVAVLGTHTFAAGNETADIVLQGSPSVVINLTGTLTTGYFDCYTSPNVTDFGGIRSFYSIQLVRTGLSITNAQFTSPDQLIVTTGGMTRLRLEVAGGFAGNLVATVYASSGQNQISLSDPLPMFLTTTARGDAATNSPNLQTPPQSALPLVSIGYPYVFNGSTHDQWRGANAAANTTGTGLAGAGILGYDGSKWQYAAINASNALKVDDTAALKAGTGAETNVAASVTDVTLLAANASRLGASIYNDSTAVLYVLDANAASSATVYTTQVPAGALYEVPFRYTGIIKGIWAAANGSARICEFSP